MQFLELLLDWQNLRLDFGVDAVIYAVMALAGTTLFLLRLIVSLLLGGGGADFDADDLDHGGGGFPLISLLSLTAFFMGAGWMGLIARVDWGLGPTPAAFASGGFGFTLMLLSASLMFGARKLTQDVTYDTKTAVGRTGQVYMAIPPKGGGSGQVRVSVSGRSMIVNANSAGPALEAFTDVKVVDVRDDQTLIVEPVEG
jgi:membrane protein implicated in regulation of membrane protease activity